MNNEFSNVNNNQNNFNNMNQNPVVPKNNNKLLIIIGILVLIGLAVAAIFIFKSPSKENEKNEGNNKQESQNESTSTNTTISGGENIIKLKNGDYLIAYKNNNDYYVSVSGKVNFYKGSELVGSDFILFDDYIAPHKTGYAEIHTSLVAKEFDKIVPDLEVEQFTDNVYDDKISHTEEKLGEFIIVKLTNNSGVLLDTLTVAVVYYDSNNNIVGYEDDSFHNVENGKTEVSEISLPEDEDFNVISYSRYELIITADE